MKVADLTVEELRNLIRQAIQEELRQIFADPDKGFELNPEIEARLEASFASRDRISFDEARKRLQLP